MQLECGHSNPKPKNYYIYSKIPSKDTIMISRNERLHSTNINSTDYVETKLAPWLTAGWLASWLVGFSDRHAAIAVVVPHRGSSH